MDRPSLGNFNRILVPVPLSKYNKKFDIEIERVPPLSLASCSLHMIYQIKKLPKMLFTEQDDKA